MVTVLFNWKIWVIPSVRNGIVKWFRNSLMIKVRGCRKIIHIRSIVRSTLIDFIMVMAKSVTRMGWVASIGDWLFSLTV